MAAHTGQRTQQPQQHEQHRILLAHVAQPRASGKRRTHLIGIARRTQRDPSQGVFGQAPRSHQSAARHPLLPHQQLHEGTAIHRLQHVGQVTSVDRHQRAALVHDIAIHQQRMIRGDRVARQQPQPARYVGSRVDRLLERAEQR